MYSDYPTPVQPMSGRKRPAQPSAKSASKRARQPQCSFAPTVRIDGVVAHKDQEGSAALLLAGTLGADDSEVVLKVTHGTLPKEGSAKVRTANGYELEAALYVSVLHTLLTQTPHLVRCHATLACPDLSPLTELAQDNVRRRVGQWRDDGGEAPILAVVLERCRCRLLDSLKPAHLPPPEAFALLAQAAYTFACMSAVGLVHGDIHGRNVFVKRLAQAQTTYYRLRDSAILAVTTKSVLRLFDWDRATKLPTQRDLRDMAVRGRPRPARSIDWLAFAELFYEPPLEFFFDDEPAASPSGNAPVSDWVRASCDLSPGEAFGNIPAVRDAIQWLHERNVPEGATVYTL